MNLGVFNRVNLNIKGGGMYSEWASLSSLIQNGNEESQSVLGKFPLAVGKEVALAVVRQLATNLGIKHQAAEPSPLSTDREVQWCMEVICFGLSLPLSEHDTIRDCVHVYCEWLSALHPVAKMSVPRPVCEDPNLYSRKMISHFHNLFVPRKGEGADTINRQAVLCHRVLRTLQHLAQLSHSLTRETWETLLLFLLAINDTLLAPPTVKDDVGDQLCERVLSVLFEVWLLACTRCFPSPPLWKTFRETCMNWRHRAALVEQWNRVNLALTARLLDFMYGPTFPELKIPEEDAQLIPAGMTNDCIAQSWFRLIHCLGNPVNLCRPTIVGQTQKFLQFAITSETVIDPCQHPCLAQLPLIFLKAIRGIAHQVDAFLGIAQSTVWEEAVSFDRLDKKEGLSHSPTPPPMRRLAKSFSVAPSTVNRALPKSSLVTLTNMRQTSSTPNSGPSSASSMNSLGAEWIRTAPAPARPKCNSVLHLFGDWLLEAALIDCGEEYEPGRAEALGALCRIICSKKTGETIAPVYLARFYLAVGRGLASGGDTLAAVLLNSADLLRLDLDGVQVLLPHVVAALELVLPDKELNPKSNWVAKTELRRASIHLLLSMLALPLHFQNLAIRDLTGGPSVTFAQLKPRLVNHLINALQVEADSQNAQMLLGGLLLTVMDSAAAEAMDLVTQPHSDVTEHTGNLLSSVSDTSSTVGEDWPEDTASLIFTDYPLGLNKNSAHALFVRATYLVCHRLISSWKTDLQVSLAALELLSGLARTYIRDSDALECKRAVKWVCDYIAYQCWRPPPSHSKDLHSSIVAAFHCLCAWLMAHPYLLQDKDCLHTVLEVVELGISGSKSQGKPGEPIRMKDEKELKPASMRVRDAAEALLTLILEQVGCFPSPTGPESVSSLMDEDALLRHCNSDQRFRYFVVDDAILLALLEEPLANDQDGQPTVTLLIRGPFGRHAWTMQLRQLARHKAGTQYHAPNPGRPVPMGDQGVKHDVKPKYFPDSVDRIPQCTVDKSIPRLDSLLIETELCLLVDQQALLETKADNEVKLDPGEESTPPSPCHEFQTARLFLSHFGLLNGSSVCSLDSESAGFAKDVESLDSSSPRTQDTVLVVYIRAGQTSINQILNSSATEVDPHFHEFIQSLGWPRGNQQTVYWADASSEITFIVPNERHTPSPDTKVLVVWMESFEDHLLVPLEDLGVGMDCVLIGLQSLRSGLLRVKLIGPRVATPLVDGMVVSRRVLGALVRQTALNACRRRRLHNDSYQPPHVRRRLKVQDMAFRYRCEMAQPELLTTLFAEP